MKVATLLPVLCALFAGASDASDTRPNRPLSVVSLNVAKETRVHRVLADFQDAAAVRNADVFLLQEVAHDGPNRPGVADALAKRMGLHVFFAPAKSGELDQGLAILSRFPLKDRTVLPLPAFDLRFRSRSRFALAATLETPAGDVRVFNVHLDTRLNSADRIAQLAPVLAEAETFPGPGLIGGDFNTNPLYWVGRILPVLPSQQQDEAVRKAMELRGFSTPFLASGATFDWFGFRLDWIYEKHLPARAHRIYPMTFSDHHALWAEFIPAETARAHIKMDSSEGIWKTKSWESITSRPSRATRKRT